MKKTTLLLCLFMASVMMPQSVWADVTVNYGIETKTLTISSPSSSDAGTLTGEQVSGCTAATSIILSGYFNSDDLSKLSSASGFSSVTSVDMSDAHFVVTPNSTIRLFSSESDRLLYTNANNKDKSILGNLFKNAKQKEWVQVNANEASNATEADFPESDIEQHTNYAANTCFKFLQSPAYSYYQKRGSLVWDQQYNLTDEQKNGATEFADQAALEEAKTYANVDKYAKVGENYYQLKERDYNYEWILLDSTPTPEPENEVDKVPETWDQNYSHLAIVKVKNYHFYQLRETEVWEWQQQVSFEPGFSLNEGSLVGIYSTPDALNDISVPNNGVFYVIVAQENSEKIYYDSQWVTVAYDWTQIKFGLWGSTIQTAILPDGVTASQLNTNDLWNNSTCGVLTSVQSGSTTAAITQTENNRSAEITAASAEEFNRMSAILQLGTYIVSNNITQAQSATDTDYIRYNATTGVYDVLVTYGNSLATKYAALSPKPADGATFVFDKDCVNFNADDLKALAPSGNHYYIDLFNVVTSNDVETAIEDAVKGLDTNNGYFYKGMLLPKNPTKVGTGLIAGIGKKSPVSEFIAYNSGNTTAAHIYNSDSSNDTGGQRSTLYQNNLTKLKSIMDAHVDDDNKKVIEEATDVYLVSTNFQAPIANVDNIKGSATATIVHTYNNEMVSNTITNPTIVVKSATAGDYAEVNTSTNVRNTANTDVLKFTGNINASDIAAVNNFTQVIWDNSANNGQGGYVQAKWDETNSKWVAAGENDTPVYNGPRVLDLSEVTGLTEDDAKTWLSQLNNPKIQYIILPAGMDETAVCNYAELANLKCVISSNKSTDTATNKVLTAYVRTAGSLAEARCLATGNDDNSSFKPTAQGLTAINLSGNLNASDIGASQDGHAFKGEKATVTSINLEKAYFENVSEMVLGNGNFSGNTDEISLTEVKLPTDKRMKLIPDNCLFGISTLTNLHIPYNYETIGWNAFWQSGIDHITTEDNFNGAVIDNGPKTYTLSANIKVLGKKGMIESTAVFPENQFVHVTDVYCLATTTPICYAHTFHSDMVYGNGGPASGPYCQEKYFNPDEKKYIATLHFPSKSSFNSEDAYNAMLVKYTDPTRDYHKKDQTGAVDANGDPMRWPDQGEMLHSRQMALDGHIWSEYPQMQYQAGGTAHLVSLGNPSPSETNSSFYPDYVGWHEFILSQATHVDPTEIVTEEKVIERKYVDAGWYTICIPYNLTRSQVLKMMGVPASTAKVKNYLGSKNAETNETTYTEVTDDKMPNIRQLQAVIRKKKGVGDTENQVRIRLTTNLYNDETQHTSFLEFTEEAGNISSIASVDADGVDGKKNSTDPICLVGGRPYVIKVYKREGEKISQQNIGKYILTRYGDELGLSASCLNNGSEYFEQLVTASTDPKVKETMHFAKPYEKHLVQALADDGKATPITYTEGTGVDAKTYRYYYTFQGQFWDQDMPEYCFYMAKGTWYHYMNTSYNYIWNAYKCVIMATPLEVVAKEPVIPETVADVMAQQQIAETTPVVENAEVANTTTVKAELEKAKTEDVQSCLDWTKHWGVGSRWYPFCWFPQAQTGTNDLLKSDFRLGFWGRNDDDFSIWGMSRYIFEFDDEIVVEYDEEGNQTTAIDTLDGTRQQVSKSDRVYSISGQYMGTSTDNLPKGIYIIGGRKIVVD